MPACCRAGNTDAFCVSHKFPFAGQPSSSLCGTLTGGGGGSSSGQTHAFAGSTEASSSAALGDSGPFGSLAPALRVCGLTVSPTDEQIAVATAAGKLMVLNIAAAVEAREEAASTAGAVPADGPRSQCGSVDGAAVAAEPGAAMGVALDALAEESIQEQVMRGLIAGSQLHRRCCLHVRHSQRHGMPVEHLPALCCTMHHASVLNSSID